MCSGTSIGGQCATQSGGHSCIGRGAHVFAKAAGEVALIGIPGCDRDLGQGAAAFVDWALGVLESAVLCICRRCDLSLLTEEPTEVARAQPRSRGESGEGEALPLALLD